MVNNANARHQLWARVGMNIVVPSDEVERLMKGDQPFLRSILDGKHGYVSVHGETYFPSASGDINQPIYKDWPEGEDDCTLHVPGRHPLHKGAQAPQNGSCADLWLRVGMTLKVGDEALQRIVNGENEVIPELVCEQRGGIAVVDGDTYFPHGWRDMKPETDFCL